MTNIEFMRKAEFDDLAEYMYIRLSNSYIHYEICGKYTTFGQCDFDCVACIKEWLNDEKRDVNDTI